MDYTRKLLRMLCVCGSQYSHSFLTHTLYFFFFETTDNEDENKRPDIKNYDFLYRLYGLVPGAESYDPPTAAPTFEPLPTFSPIEDVGDGSSQQIDSGPGGRLLEEWDDDVMEASILDARQRIMSEEKIGVRVLHQSSRGELHEADLAYGHRLRIEKLFPNEGDF